MTTVTSKSGRTFEVTIREVGNGRYKDYDLSYGGVFLASTGQRGPNGETSSTLEITIERADTRADELCLIYTDTE